MSANVRQKRFAKLVAAGTPQRRAYIEAGYEPTTENAMDANASRLVRNDKVAPIIEQERMKLEDDERFKVEALADRYHKYEVALANEGQFKAAADVVDKQAKLAGHLVDKREDVSKLPDDKILELVEKLKGD